MRQVLNFMFGVCLAFNLLNVAVAVGVANIPSALGWSMASMWLVGFAYLDNKGR